MSVYRPDECQLIAELDGLKSILTGRTTQSDLDFKESTIRLLMWHLGGKNGRDELDGIPVYSPLEFHGDGLSGQGRE